MISGYTAVKVKGGIHSVFQAMETNETITIKYHNDALKVDLPSDIRNIIHKHLKTEERHLAYIRKIHQ